MKAALCVSCTDILAPYGDWQINREWRWCQCRRVGVRWRDGAKGLLEVTSMEGPDYVRVLGINNQVLVMACDPGLSPRSHAEWRTVHEVTCREVEPFYLFHEDKRNCWALLIRPGETGDVTLVDYAAVKAAVPAAAG